MSTKWNIELTQKLFALVNEKLKCGQSATSAFIEMAKEMETTPNSVRGYYYAQQRIFSLLPEVATKLNIEFFPVEKKDFALFSTEQIERLIETILVRRANERSIRSIIADMANGDAKLALRYQNKYRSMVFTHSDRVKKLTDKMQKSGKVFYDPYLKKVVGGQDTAESETEKIESLLSTLTDRQREAAVRLLLHKK